jgi:hypothetical protein
MCAVFKIDIPGPAFRVTRDLAFVLLATHIGLIVIEVSKVR